MNFLVTRSFALSATEEVQLLIAVPITSNMLEWAQKRNLEGLAKHTHFKNDDFSDRRIMGFVGEAAFFCAFRNHAHWVNKSGIDYRIGSTMYEVKTKRQYNLTDIASNEFTIEKSQIDLSKADQFVLTYYRKVYEDIVIVGTIDPTLVPEVGRTVKKGEKFSAHNKGTCSSDCYVIDLKYITPIESLINSLGGLYAFKEGLIF